MNTKNFVSAVATLSFGLFLVYFALQFAEHFIDDPLIDPNLIYLFIAGLGLMCWRALKAMHERLEKLEQKNQKKDSEQNSGGDPKNRGFSNTSE